MKHSLIIVVLVGCLWFTIYSCEWNVIISMYVYGFNSKRMPIQFADYTIGTSMSNYSFNPTNFNPNQIEQCGNSCQFNRKKNTIFNLNLNSMNFKSTQDLMSDDAVRLSTNQWRENALTTIVIQNYLNNIITSHKIMWA